jgi:hypothetical protein
MTRRKSAKLTLCATLVLSTAQAGPVLAKSAVSCGGAALVGGAQLLCSHVDPKAPAQL